MDAKHTPGPWEVRTEFGFTYIRPATHKARGYSSGYAPIAKVIGDKRIGQQEENARLIAAAPELLVALEAIVNAWEEGRAFSDKMNEIGKARAAIAKAKGDLAGMWDAIPDDERAELTRAFAAGFAEQSKGGEQ